MSNPDMFRYEWIWDKGKGSNPLLSKKQPMKSHENILVFSKLRTTYNPQMTEGKPYLIPRTGGNRTNSITNAKDSVDFQQKTDPTKRFPTTIQKYSIHCGSKIHPTQKPVALFEYLIKTYTNEGDTVLDNCAGSGTTAIACINTKRNYILIENEKEYIDIINKRLSVKAPLPVEEK